MTTHGCVDDGKRAVRPTAAEALRADGTAGPRRPGTGRRHPGNGLHRSVLAGRRRGTTSTGSSPSTPRSRAPTVTPPKPTRTGPGRVGCSTGQPACPCGDFSRVVRPRLRRRVMHAMVPQGPIGSPPRTPRRIRRPVAGRHWPSPAREPDKITPKTARQVVPELRNSRRDQPGGSSSTTAPADTTKTAFPSLRKRPLTCDFKSRDDRI